MKVKTSLFVLLQIFFVGFVHANSLAPVRALKATMEQFEVVAKDSNGPVQKAFIWIESLEGKLLLRGTTGSEGSFRTNSPDVLAAPKVNVTVWAIGHNAVSLMETTAKKVEFTLALDPRDEYAIYNGKMTGMAESDDETEGMIGIVARALSSVDLASLEVSALVSPLMDSVDVMGKRDIPSNIILPDQTFPIFFVPVRVNKPSYRYPVIAGSSNRIFGVSGLVDVQATVSAIRKNEPWEILNLLKIKKLGVTDWLQAPKGKNQTEELNLATSLNISEKLNIAPGKYSSAVKLESPLRRVGVSVNEPQAGVYIPTDIKLVRDDFKGLGALDKKARVFDMLATEDGSHYRSEWHPASVKKFPDISIQADFTSGPIENRIPTVSPSSTTTMIARLEDYKKSSIGSKSYNERWIVVSPKKADFQFPVQAWHDLKERIGAISHLSFDFMQMGANGLTLLDQGDDVTIWEGVGSHNKVLMVEKVRKAL